MHDALALAHRLEQAEGQANAAFVAARARLQPEVGAASTVVAGARCMFDGADSPLTQTFGLGLAPCDDAALDAMEAFFAERGAPVAHELCTLVPSDLVTRLAARGYVPLEASAVHVRTITPRAAPSGTLHVRAIGPGDAAMWARTAREGWSAEAPELGEFLEQMGGIIAGAEGATCFVAEQGGAPVATAALVVHEGVALLAGASTVPSARRQGAQQALLDARLAFAAAHGADLAMVVTQPGSASQRNALRQGFRPVYTRAKWVRALGVIA